MELVQNKSTLATRNSKPIKLRRLKNGVPQGSVVAVLFSIYIYDLLPITSKKCAYADDLVILHSSEEWKKLEKTLTQDMIYSIAYLQTEPGNCS